MTDTKTTSDRALLEQAAEHYVFLKRIAQSSGPIRCEGKIVGKWQTVARECQVAHDKIIEHFARCAESEDVLLGAMGPGVERNGEGFVSGGRPICVFCNSPWSDDMIRVYDIDASHGHGSYDFGPEDQRATVDITCSNCKRLIYRKEYQGE